jgi:import receptor subunit TOM70
VLTSLDPPPLSLSVSNSYPLPSSTLHVQYLEAAQAFTEALDLIAGMDSSADGSSSLVRQAITLMNNRSAMYEKGGMQELALEDCVAILDKEIGHTKARTRKLRILEGLKRWPEALVEVCAVQLLFMQSNRNNLRMGLPVPPPPVPQSKMEEILMEIIPSAEEKYLTAMSATKSRPLPSSYTILQLLRSYNGYKDWMSASEKDGPVEEISTELFEATDTALSATRATVLAKRGRRYAYDRVYDLASTDFEEAYALVESSPEVRDAMEKTDYARLLEWTGMVRHWHYDLDSAMECYKKCAELEPTNALILVKMAGVQMDGGHHDEALKFFDAALEIYPSFGDALLHRSNLRMLQAKAQLAKRDLQKLLETNPNNVMARLRLASILAATNDPDGAQTELDMAEKAEPNSSEVQSYRGELHFTQGEMEDARKQFEKAMELEPTNPTPYVNAAMALLNTPPPPGQMPDAQGVMRLLERAIEVDPQFTAAYIQLGQLKLGTATDLAAAGDVVKLYDQGLKNCRSPEEVKELVSMRTLAEAQVDAASLLKMETFNMQ